VRSERRILVGEFGRPHGVRGLVTLRAFTADPEALGEYGPLSDESGTRRFALELLPNGLARVEGVADRDAAARLTGTKLFVERDALPPTEEDEFYLADLVGLDAFGPDGRPLGRVAAVEDFGAGAFLTLRGEGGERDVPFTRACVPEVSLEARRLVVVLPDEGAEPPGGPEAPDGVGEGGS